MSLYDFSMVSYDQLSERTSALVDSQFASLQNAVQQLSRRIQHINGNQSAIKLASRTTDHKEKESQQLLRLEQLLLALERKIQIVVQNVSNQIKTMSHKFQDKFIIMQSINRKLKEQVQYLEQNASKQIESIYNQYQTSFITLTQNSKRIEKSLTDRIQYFQLKFSSTTQKENLREKDYLDKIFKLEQKVKNDKQNIQQLQLKIQNMEQEIIVLKRQVNDEKTIKKTFENQFVKLQIQIKQLEAQNNSLKASNLILNKTKDQLMSKLKKYEQQKNLKNSDKHLKQSRKMQEISYMKKLLSAPESSLNPQSFTSWNQSELTVTKGQNSIEENRRQKQAIGQSRQKLGQQFLQEFHDSQQEDTQDIFIR